MFLSFTLVFLNHLVIFMGVRYEMWKINTSFYAFSKINGCYWISGDKFSVM